MDSLQYRGAAGYGQYPAASTRQRYRNVQPPPTTMKYIYTINQTWATRSLLPFFCYSVALLITRVTLILIENGSRAFILVFSAIAKIICKGKNQGTQTARNP